MLKYGVGLGVRAVINGLSKLFDIDALRPPTTSDSFFKRTIGSTNWIPMPIGSEGSGAGVNGAATPNGASATTSVGTVITSGAARTLPSGTSATGNVGNAIAQANATVSIPGVNSATNTGTVTVSGNAVCPVAGIGVTGEQGDSSAKGDGACSVSGVEYWATPPPYQREQLSPSVTV
jgi:hypothetical protein